MSFSFFLNVLSKKIRKIKEAVVEIQRQSGKTGTMASLLDTVSASALVSHIVKDDVITRVDQVFGMCAALDIDLNYVRRVLREQDNSVPRALRELLTHYYLCYYEKHGVDEDHPLVMRLLAAAEQVGCRGAFVDMMKIRGIKAHGDLTKKSQYTEVRKSDIQKAVCFLANAFPYDNCEICHLAVKLELETFPRAVREIRQLLLCQGHNHTFIEFLLRGLDKHGTQMFPLRLYQAMQCEELEYSDYKNLLLNCPELEPLQDELVRQVMVEIRTTDELLKNQTEL